MYNFVTQHVVYMLTVNFIFEFLNFLLPLFFNFPNLIVFYKSPEKTLYSQMVSHFPENTNFVFMSS